jgi:Domain of unknown function (DUF222)
MESNTHSVQDSSGLGLLAAAVDQLAVEDLDALSDAEAARRVLVLRGLIQRLEGHWLRELAGVDGRGAAGADTGTPAESTAGWLRQRTRMGHPDAHQRVRVARALHRGPLAGTAQALAEGEVSYQHAAALTRATQALPPATTAAAEPVLLEAARRLDPPTLRKVVGHLVEVADPDTAHEQTLRRHERRGLWVAPTFEGMVAIDGLLNPEAGETLLTALEPLARPTVAEDERTAAQRNADALTELARRQLEGGRLPQAGGVRPQVVVTVDLASLLGQAGLPGGEGGWVGPLPVKTARRLACDATVTRVVVTRQQHHPAGGGDHHRTGDNSDRGSAGELGDLEPAGPVGDGNSHPAADHGDRDPAGDLAARLRTAMPLLPPALGGARPQPLDVGRATRVVSPTQRSALTVRDGGCRFPGCDRPVAWCDAHHLRHWLHGGATDLGNLVLLCPGHHHAVHEGGWRLHRHADGTFTATPPHRRRTTAA